MNFLQDYAILIMPIIAGLAAQAYKLATDQIKGNFSFKEIITSLGGMPSAHTAFVVSLSTVVGLLEGLTSPIFAVSIIFMIIVIRDAMGFRIILGDQGKIINYLKTKLSEEERSKLPALRDQYGHTIAEVFWGSAAGVGLSLLYYYLVF